MSKKFRLKSIKEEVIFAVSILKFDSKEIFYIIFYSALIGFLGIFATISVQFLINSISFTGQSDQVTLLGGLTSIVLLFISGIQILRKIAAEKIEQRTMVRLTLAAADNLSSQELKKSDWSRGLIVHRFFDVFNYQIYLNKLLLNGLGLTIFTILGLIFVIFYHPILALLAIVILVSFFGIVFFFFEKGILTEHKQSEEKYKIAAWLSFVAEARTLFKRKKSYEYLISETDLKTKNYLNSRQIHFNVCTSQQALLYFVQAIGAGVFLGAGGFFVIDEKINLGQLVAIEFGFLSVLYGISAFGNSMENFYSMVVSAKNFTRSSLAMMESVTSKMCGLL